MTARILVTGASGYLGSVLCRRLVEEGYQVLALDNSPQAGIFLSEASKAGRFSLFEGDVCDEVLMRELISQSDVIIPLAAIVGAPACDTQPSLAQDTNLQAIRLLKRLCRSQQVVLFPMTNSGYRPLPGMTSCDENTLLESSTLYGQTKLQAERELLESPNAVSFRLASLFGVSPHMRWDLLLNHFVCEAVTQGVLELFEDGFKRNFVHVEDVADCFIHGIRNAGPMGGRAYNVGIESGNLTKGELALKIKEQIPSLEIRRTDSAKDPDRRDFFVSCERLKQSGFQARRTIEEGIRELIGQCKIENHPTIEAVILVGGQGTRLRTVLGEQPKALAKIGDRPFLSVIFDQLIEAEFSSVTLCTGFGKEAIRQAFGDHYQGLKVRYSEELEALGTGGALRYVQPALKSNWVLVMNGDSFCDIKLRDFVRSSQERPGSAHMVLARVPNAERYGSIEVNHHNQIVRFSEKVPLRKEGWINAGIYCFQRDLILHIPKGKYVSLEEEIFPVWARASIFYGYPCGAAPFIDIGTPDSCENAQEFFGALLKT